MPVSCLECHCKILSDPVLSILEAFDWAEFSYLEEYKGKGCYHVHSRIGLLKALLYLELAGLPSVHELLRVLGRDPNKMRIIGLDRLPHDSVFSNFKKVLGKTMDRMVARLTGMLHKQYPDLYVRLGVDSTKVEAYTYKDKQA